MGTKKIKNGCKLSAGNDSVICNSGRVANTYSIDLFRCNATRIFLSFDVTNPVNLSHWRGASRISTQ